MKEKEKAKNVSKQKQKGKKSVKKALIISTYVILIILISLISFIGIYVQDKNKMSNVLREYILGTDLFGARNIVIKVDDGTQTKKYDEQGNLVTDDNTEDTNITTVEEPVNKEEVLTAENYQKVKDIVISRLEYMKLDYYEIKFNESDGTIYLEVPESSAADYAAQYSITKGEFKISDYDTNEVLLSNSDVKDAKVQYATTESGTTVYLNIKFTKEGSTKLKDISNTYVKTTDSEGNEVIKKLKMTLDDTTIKTTYFDEEINDGQIQIPLGTSTDSEQIQNYLTQGANIAIFLNTDPMPITYKIEVNRLVYSDITANTLKILLIVSTIVFALLLVSMIVKYKKEAILAAITNIGFVAILLIVIRYTNVDITLTGLVAIALSILLEYIFLMDMLKVKTEKINKESKGKAVKVTIINWVEKLIPLAIMSVVFALGRWEPVYSVGMLLFWGITILVLYNLVTLKIMFMKDEKNK